MEEIYMKGFLGRRMWCSDKVHLNSFFEKYSEEVCVVPGRKITEYDILQQFVPQSNQLSDSELNTLAHITDASQLTNLLAGDVHKQPCFKMKKEDEPSTSKIEKNVKPDHILSNSVPFHVLKKPNRLRDFKRNTSRKEVIVDSAKRCGSKNLKANEHFVVTFRVHEPFHHLRVDWSSRPGRCMQEMVVPGHMTLDKLRDSIICESDYQDTRGDISQMPTISSVKDIARNKYLSNMFYFDNTFFVDWRHPSCIDYSLPIRKWATTRGLKLGPSVSMADTLVGDLEIRFGYPYLYMHQGCCEHVIIVSDARLLSPRDSLYDQDYPLMARVSQLYNVTCMVCSQTCAKYIIRESDHVAHDPTYMCRDCFKSLHYVNGQKIGNFKAYQYWQRSTIL